MDKPTFKWWVNRHSELEKELMTWKMYCQQLARDVDALEEKMSELALAAKPAMKVCRINHDDYDTVELCQACSAVKAFNDLLHNE